MKALTIKQPWASLIFHGKDIENRTWKTSFRGRILIHAGASFDSKERSFNEWFERPLTRNQYESLDHGEQFAVGYGLTHLLPTSAIIGSVEIIDCVVNHPSVWAEKSESFAYVCQKNNCPEFIEWQIEGGVCQSCKIVGQSYNVDTIPRNCFFKGEMPKAIYNWVLANPVLFDKPIPAKGKLSLWDFEIPA